MDIFIALVAGIGGLVVFALLARGFGADMHRSDWTHGGYDPRDDWNARR